MQSNIHRKPLVLVIEDDSDDAQDIMAWLSGSKRELRIHVAASVEEAIAFAEDHAPESDDAIDLVILDLVIPQTPGAALQGPRVGFAQLPFLRTYRYIRPNVPILILTHYESFALAVRAMQEGADQYILKQNASIELPRAVDRYLFEKGEDMYPGAPSPQWWESNAQYVREQFGGLEAVFVPVSELRRVRAQMPRSLLRDDFAVEKMGEIVDGVLVIARERYEDVRSVIARSPELRSIKPLITLVEREPERAGTR